MTSLQPLSGFLTADLSSVSTTVEVDDPTLATGTDQIAILAPSSQRVEIMTITGGSGTHASPWTVVRAQRGTTATAHGQGAKVQGVNFRLTVGDLDFTMRWNNLVEGDTSPGGNDQLSFKRFVPDPVVVPGMGDLVYLSRSTSTTVGVWTDKGVWTGLVEDAGPHYYPKGGADLNLQAVGYREHLGDMPYQASKVLDPATSIPPGLSVAGIVETAIRDQCQLILSDFSHVSAGGQGILYATGDLLGKTPLQLITEYTPIGDGFVPNEWAVRGFGTNGAYFELKRKPESPLYQINIEDTIDGVTVHPRRSNVYTTVLVRWHDGVAQWTNEDALVSLHGIRRGILIDASSFIGDGDTATSYAKTLANLLGTFRPMVGEARMYLTKPISLVAGGTVEPWDVVAGEMLQVLKAGSILSSNNTNLPYPPGFFIRSVKRDYQAGTITFATSDEESEIGRMIARVAHTELARQDSQTKAVTGPQWSNPNTPSLPVPSPLPPSMRLSKAQDGRVGYEDSADGTDTGTAALEWGGSGTDNPALIDTNVDSSFALHTPMLIHSGQVRVIPFNPTNPKPSCTIEVYQIKVTLDDATTGAQSYASPTLIDTITIDETSVEAEPLLSGADPATQAYVLKKRRQYKPPKELGANDWLIGRISANDPTLGVRYANVSLRYQKMSGQSEKPAGQAGGVAATARQAQRGGDQSSPNATSVGATFIVTTSDYARVEIQYGLQTNGLVLGWSSRSPLGKMHVLTVPTVPRDALFYNIVMYDQYGGKSVDNGNILY